MFKNSLLFYLLITLFSVSALAQAPDVDKLSDKQIEQFLKEAEARGMSEAQVEAAAMANGYSAMDIAKVRERIGRIKTNTTDTTTTQNATARKQIGKVATRTVVPVSDSTEVGKKKEVYGYALFNNASLTFEPNLRLPTPQNYVLGAGDKLKVDITGYAYQHYDLEVSPEGSVKLESLSPINVNGLTISQAKYKIVSRLKTLFAGLRNGSLNVDVTLGDVRTIQVTILGEVVKPGSYNISSLATAFNALYLSGGPTPLGSLRNIQVLRKNKQISTIDIYEFLSRGSFVSNVQLQDQDVILIPTAHKKVELVGEVKRQMVFELKQNETLADAIKYAGGFTEQAYKASINVKRNTDKERKLITISADIADSFITKDGDNYFIETILDRFENKVEVLGAVFRPGEFALGSELKTVKQLIKKADGFREDAFLSRAILVREQENADPIFMPLNIGAIARGEAQDVELKRQDKLVIKSLVEVREERTVNIEGAVGIPGTFEFIDGMTVNDLVLLSGGFLEGATEKRIEIARRIKSDDATEKSVEIINISTGKSLSVESGDIALQPFDKIFVRLLSNYEEQKIATIEGQVNYPGSYAIQTRTERISDFIKRAGGLKPEAYPKGAKFFRNGKQVALNLENILNKSASDLLMQDGDKIEIPRVAETVSFQGQLLNPIEVAFQPDFSFQDYITQAGGYTDSAFVSKTYVVYANGLTDRTRSYFGMRIYPKVERGMTVVVPTRRRSRWSGAERVAVSTGFVSLSAVLLTLFRLL